MGQTRVTLQQGRLPRWAGVIREWLTARNACFSEDEVSKTTPDGRSAGRWRCPPVAVASARTADVGVVSGSQSPHPLRMGHRQEAGVAEPRDSKLVAGHGVPAIEDRVEVLDVRGKARVGTDELGCHRAGDPPERADAHEHESDGDDQLLGVMSQRVGTSPR